MVKYKFLGIENGPEDVLKHFQLWRFLRKRSDGDVVKDGIGFLFGVDPKEEVDLNMEICDKKKLRKIDSVFFKFI